MPGLELGSRLRRQGRWELGPVLVQDHERSLSCVVGCRQSDQRQSRSAVDRGHSVGRAGSPGGTDRSCSVDQPYWSSVLYGSGLGVCGCGGEVSESWSVSALVSLVMSMPQMQETTCKKRRKKEATSTFVSNGELYRHTVVVVMVFERRVCCVEGEAACEKNDS